MRVAKVIATCFVPRFVREVTGISGKPMGFFSHSQNFPTRESVIDLINFTIETELKCDPGVAVDLIIVNNDAGWQQGRDFLDSIDGRELPHGSIRVLHRKNFGLSFGAYSYAFQELGSDYDFFIFTEDDVIIARDQYAAKGIELFNNAKNCGFVAYVNVSSTGVGLSNIPHAHGGIGISSVAVMQEVVMQCGSLPHVNEQLPQTYLNHLIFGEIAFTNVIHKMGFKLVNAPRHNKLYDFAYDLMRELDVRRYPSLPEKLLLVAKRWAYKYKIVRYLHGFVKPKRDQGDQRPAKIVDWAGR